MGLNNEIISGFDDENNDTVALNIQRVNPKTMIVKAVGYIDTYNTPFFTKKINKIFDSGVKDLIFDLSGVVYMSSTGIGAFTGFLKTTRSVAGRIVLVNVQPKVFEVFQLLGFSQFFDLKDSVEQAIEILKSEPTENNYFPTSFKCPICSRKLKTEKPGRFRCPECKTILTVDKVASVKLG